MSGTLWHEVGTTNLHWLGSIIWVRSCRRPLLWWHCCSCAPGIAPAFIGQCALMGNAGLPKVSLLGPLANLGGRLATLFKRPFSGPSVLKPDQVAVHPQLAWACAGRECTTSIYALAVGMTALLNVWVTS